MAETGRIEYAPDYQSIRSALGVLDVLSFNGVPGAAITEDAVQSLDALVAERDRYRERCFEMLGDVATLRELLARWLAESTEHTWSIENDTLERLNR